MVTQMKNKNQVKDATELFDNFQYLPFFVIPYPLLAKLLSTYEFLGKMKSYQEKIQKEEEGFKENGLIQDSLLLCEKKKISCSESRLKQLLHKKVMPKNKEEKKALLILKTLQQIRVYSADNQPYNCSDIFNDLVNLYEKNQVQYNMKPMVTSKYQMADFSKSHRSFFNHLLDEYELYYAGHKYESIILGCLCFMEIRLIHPFVDEEMNQMAGSLALMRMLLRIPNLSFSYQSFFEFYNKKEQAIENELNLVSINYPDQPLDIGRMVSIIFELIEDANLSWEKLLKQNDFSHQAFKSDHLEVIIRQKMPNIFTKEDIRGLYPSASSMTITRVLNKLKEEGLIKPLSTGRNAQWIKLNLQQNKTEEDNGK